MTKWDKYIQAALKAKDRYTQVAGSFSDGTSDPDPEENNLNFDVIEVLPNRSEKGDIYLLSGTPESLPPQISLFLALEEMVSVRVGNIPLAQWIEDYETEFLLFEGKNRPKDNYAKPWGLPSDEKPRLDIVEIGKNLKRNYLVCQYFPNRKNDEEYYWFSGTSSQIINQVMLFTNLSKKLERYTFGEFYGYPVPEYNALFPSQYTNIKLFFTTRKHPPYYKGSSTELFVKVQISVPMVAESKLTYENIRKICNGSNGINYGHWQDRAYLAVNDKSKGISQMVVGGHTEKEAIANMDKFLVLTNAKVMSRRCSHDSGGHEKAKADIDWEKKNNYEIYPWFMTVTNPVKVKTKPDKGGVPTRAGTIKHKTEKLFINTQKEPPGWSTALRKVLSKAN